MIDDVEEELDSLEEFRELVGDIDDDEMLGVAQSLLEDMIKIHDMKEKIEVLEDGLHKGDRAAFWFFAMQLEREQVDMATNMILGRKRILHDLEEKRKIKAEEENPEENGKGSLLQI